MSSNPYKDAKAQAKAAKAYAKANRPWYKKKRFWLLGLLLLAVIGSLLGGGDNKSNSSTAPQTTSATKQTEATTSGATTTAATQTTTAAKMAGMGETVHYNTFDFTVTSVKCNVSKVGNEYAEEKAQGQFCIVSMKVKNTGTKAQMFNSDGQKLFDAKGNEYSYSSEATIAQMTEQNKSDLWFKEINPGNTVAGEIVYDLPKGVKPTKMHLTDGGLTDEGVDVSLA